MCAHTLPATTEESSLASCYTEILPSSSIRPTGSRPGVALKPFPACLYSSVTFPSLFIPAIFKSNRMGLAALSIQLWSNSQMCSGWFTLQRQSCALKLLGRSTAAQKGADRASLHPDPRSASSKHHFTPKRTFWVRAEHVFMSCVCVRVCVHVGVCVSVSERWERMMVKLGLPTHPQKQLCRYGNEAIFLSLSLLHTHTPASSHQPFVVLPVMMISSHSWTGLGGQLVRWPGRQTGGRPANTPTRHPASSRGSSLPRQLFRQFRRQVSVKYKCIVSSALWGSLIVEELNLYSSYLCLPLLGNGAITQRGRAREAPRLLPCHSHFSPVHSSHS